MGNFYSSSLSVCVLSHSVVFNSLWLYGLYPLGSCVHGIIRQVYWSGLLHFLTGDLPSRIQLHVSLHWQSDSYHWAIWKAPFYQWNSLTPLNLNEIPKRIHPEIIAIFTVVGVMNYLFCFFLLFKLSIIFFHYFYNKNKHFIIIYSSFRGFHNYGRRLRIPMRYFSSIGLVSFDDRIQGSFRWWKLCSPLWCLLFHKAEHLLVNSLHMQFSTLFRMESKQLN